MATRFKIQYSGHVSPIEVIEATDASNLATIIHSSIDTSFGGSKELTCGTTSTQVAYKEYTTTTSLVAFEHSTIFNSGSISCDFLFVKIKENVSASSDAIISFGDDDYEAIHLLGLGDFAMLPVKAETGDNIKIKSSSSKLCKVDILIGETE